ncbi:MAG: CPBP family glutamic-type intramembrane protease [Planctomycetota bacterium]|jgi:hypothetical protein
MNWLIRHFQRYRKRGPWAFCWRIALEGLAVSLLCALVLSQLFPDLHREILDWSAAEIFMVIVVLAPVFETLLLQALPIFIARKLKASFTVQVIASTVVFAALHFLEGIPTGICAGIIGGFYFAFTFAHWRDKSRWTAFWVTALSHAIHNAVAFVMLVLVGEV